MFRLLVDENLDQRILRGLQLRVPNVEYSIVQETPLAGAQDSALLKWAAENRHVLVTLDRRTMLKAFNHQMRAGRRSAGLVIVRRGASLPAVIEDMDSLPQCSSEEELENQVIFNPF